MFPQLNSANRHGFGLTFDHCRRSPVNGLSTTFGTETDRCFVFQRISVYKRNYHRKQVRLKRACSKIIKYFLVLCYSVVR